MRRGRGDNIPLRPPRNLRALCGKWFCFYFSPQRVAKAASMIGMPISPGEVITDSGWNCTAAIGSDLCSIAMMTRSSSVSAATDNTAGRLLRSANSEW